MARASVRWPLLLALLAGLWPATESLPGATTSAAAGNASAFAGASAARFIAARSDEEGATEEEAASTEDAAGEDGGGGGGEGEDEDWWAGAAEEDALLALALHGGEGGLWAGAFVPPPPRPDFLDERVAPDGLTTCDLCAWAWHGRPGAPGGGLLDAAADHPGKIGWALTLAIVSILSAAIGAVVMVTVLQCRNRLKTVGSSGLCSLCIRSPSPAAIPAANTQERIQAHETADDKDVTAAFDNRDGGGRVWTWLTSRRAPSGPTQLSSPAPTAPAENHYTLDEAYAAVGEALYAELDRESSSSPAYQNTAYNGSDTDPDAPPSSAPSSAYYSDLSCATAPDRTYEAVGVALTMSSNPSTSWESGEIALRRHPIPRLAAITETITVPSDYV